MPVLLHHYFKYYLLNYISINLPSKRKLKYSNEYVFNYIWKVNVCGLCWNAIDCICHYTTIYKRFIYWSTNNIFQKVYLQIRDTYLKQQKHYIYKSLYIDTMSIKNWKGIDAIGRDNKFKFKNATKISYICDENSLPIAIYATKGSVHDSSTIIETINTINLSILDKRIKINLIADKGYIKNNVFKQHLYDKYGFKLITPNRNNMNKRNTCREKKLLHNRYKIEHVNGKTLNCNRIQIRFDKYITNFRSFIYMTCINMICKFSYT